MRPVTLSLCAALALTPLTASAHAFLKQSDPRVGAAVAKTPASLRLTFTEGVVPAFCRVTVTGPAGFGGAGAVRPVAGAPATLSVDLHGPTPPGSYAVHWRVLSVDTHVTEGDFRFRVGP
jgi:hypothetical protein